MPLEGKVAIVTGAGGGIGAAIAEKLARDGADVVLMDLNQDGMKNTENKIKEAGGHAISMKVDVSRKEDVAGAVGSIVTRLKRIDILVNNAGIAYRTAFGDITEQEWDRVIDINLKGTFLCTQSVIVYMQEQRYGRIINISSMAGIMGSENAGAHYCASKAGIIGLTKYLSKSYARFGVNINAVAPGPIETDMTKGFGEDGLRALIESMPTKRMGKPEDIAGVVAFLASDEAKFITGAVIEANGGQIIV